MGDLTGRTALVTGGGRDVGAEICRVLAAAGAKVAINYNSSKAEAEKVAAEITKAGGTAATYQADVADLEQVRRMIAQVKADFAGWVRAAPSARPPRSPTRSPTRLPRSVSTYRACRRRRNGYSGSFNNPPTKGNEDG